MPTAISRHLLLQAKTIVRDLKAIVKKKSGWSLDEDNGKVNADQDAIDDWLNSNPVCDLACAEKRDTEGLFLACHILTCDHAG
jgi:hypothetical protein